MKVYTNQRAHLWFLTWMVMGIAVVATSSLTCLAAQPKTNTTMGMRTWSSSSGATVEAKLIRIDGDMVILEQKSKSQMRIAKSSLINEDQQILNVWLAETRGTGSITEPEAGMLPAFADGKWQGMNTVYEGQFYDLTFESFQHTNQSETQRLKIVLYPKDNGQRVGHPITINIQCIYRIHAQKKTFTRTLTAIESTEKPIVTSNPHSLELSGMFDDEVQLELTLDMSDRSFSLDGSIKDPVDIEHESHFGFNGKIAATHNPKTDEEWAQSNLEMKDWYIILNPPAGEKTTYAYTASLKWQAVKMVEVKGPWGGQTLNIVWEGERIKKQKQRRYGRFSVYSGMPPFRGFSFSSSGTSEHTPSKLTLEFQ